MKNVLFDMIEREHMWLRKFMDKSCDRKVAIFTAGNYARKFYKRLLDDFKIEAEFFIDNNKTLSMQKACGKSIFFEPWKTIDKFNEKYFIFISTCDVYYHQIAKQLDDVGVPYISSDAFQAFKLWKYSKNTVGLLDDDISKESYLALIWYWLTYESAYIETSDNQYFTTKYFVNPTKEIVCDIGSFVGSVLEEYVRRSLGSCQIYSFEPDGFSRSILEKRVQRLKEEWGINKDLIQIIPACIGKESRNINFLETGSMSSSVAFNDNGNVDVTMYSIDDFFKDKPSPTLIKADIEGFELDLIIGASKTIQEAKPKMAICIYHEVKDLLIPSQIHELCAEYKFAVRNHSNKHEETVLYCWV